MRQARVVLTGILGWVIILIINIVVGMVFGLGAAGFDAITSGLGG